MSIAIDLPPVYVERVEVRAQERGLSLERYMTEYVLNSLDREDDSGMAFVRAIQSCPYDLSELNLSRSQDHDENRDEVFA